MLKSGSVLPVPEITTAHSYSMLKLCQQYKPLIQNRLKGFFDQKLREYQKINKWGEVITGKTKFMSEGGKMIRGSTLMLSYEMWGGKNPDMVLPIAAAMEIFQTAILIHDDIIDNDILRRGNPTMHVSFAGEARLSGIKTPDEFGRNMALCMGDAGLFWVFEMVSECRISSEIKSRVIRMMAREYVNVILGEMSDVHIAADRKIPEISDVINFYTYKTARYTFSLPLAVGAVINGKSEKTIGEMIKLGIYMGLLFQLKDDEIGIFGDSNVTGKGIGGDISENKKTLYWIYLNQRCNDSEKSKLDRIFGKKNLKVSDLEYVKSKITKYAIHSEINDYFGQLDGKCRRIINKLPLAKNYKKVLQELTDFISARDS